MMVTLMEGPLTRTSERVTCDRSFEKVVTWKKGSRGESTPYFVVILIIIGEKSSSQTKRLLWNLPVPY